MEFFSEIHVTEILSANTKLFGHNMFILLITVYVSVLGLGEQVTPKLNGLKSPTLKREQGHVLPEAVGKLSHAFPLVSVHNLWCSLVCRCITQIFFFVFTFSSSCVSGSLSALSFHKDSSHWVRAHPHWIWFHLKMITSAKILFPKRSRSEMPKGTWILERYYIIRYKIWIQTLDTDQSEIEI